MAKTRTTRYDVAEHLRTPEEMAACLEACLEEADDDAAFIARAFGKIAGAKGMAHVAGDAGLSRKSLYKALSGDRSPGFDTILKVISALGIKLRVEARGGRDARSRRDAGAAVHGVEAGRAVGQGPNSFKERCMTAYHLARVAVMSVIGGSVPAVHWRFRLSSNVRRQDRSE